MHSLMNLEENTKKHYKFLFVNLIKNCLHVSTYKKYKKIKGGGNARKKDKEKTSLREVILPAAFSDIATRWQ